jgi:hypothetical protein
MEFNSFLTPEMNVKNLVTGDNLLELIRLRATTSIQNAYVADIDLVRDARQKHDLKLVRPGGGVYQFMEEDNWGCLLEIAPEAPKSMRQKLLNMGKGYAMVTEEDGRLVLERQMKIYPHLQALADDIMEHKRELENPSAGPTRRKAADRAAAVEALRKLDLDKQGPAHKQHGKAAMQDLRSIAGEQHETIIDHLHLLRNEPQYLANIAGQHYFYSAPDVAIPDEQGLADGQMMTGSYCDRIVKEVFADAFEGCGNWNSITVLVSALGENPARDSPVMKELWSLCLAELDRTRLLFKRMLQADEKCVKLFVRRGSTVHPKVPLNVTERKNKYLALLIGIARMGAGNEMDVAIGKALKEVHELEEQVPGYRASIHDQVGAALGDVAVITALMARLRAFMPIPKQPTATFVRSLKRWIGALKEAWGSVQLQIYASPVSEFSHHLQCLDVADISQRSIS